MASLFLSPLISTLNWFDSADLKLQHGGYLFDGEMMRQILVKKRKHRGKEVCRKHQEKAISYDSNCKINTAHWAYISYNDPQTHSWFLDLFVLIKRLMCFSREIAGQVKSPYFKHWSTIVFKTWGLGSCHAVPPTTRLFVKKNSIAWYTCIVLWKLV